LVLVTVQPANRGALKRRKLRSRYAKACASPIPLALECVKEAVGCCAGDRRVLSLGLPTHHGGRRDQQRLGNFITAQPHGRAHGIDFQYTGSVRKVDAQAIAGCLDAGNIAIVSPVGYSPTASLQLAMEDVAWHGSTAITPKNDLLL